MAKKIFRFLQKEHEKKILTAKVAILSNLYFMKKICLWSDFLDFIK